MKQTNFQVLFDYKNDVYMYIIYWSFRIFRVFNICLIFPHIQKNVAIFGCARIFFLDTVLNKSLDHNTKTCFFIFRDGKEDILNLKEENFIMQKIQR